MDARRLGEGKEAGGTESVEEGSSAD